MKSAVIHSALAYCLLFIMVGCSYQNHLDQGRAAMLLGDPVIARFHFDRAIAADASLASDPALAAEYRAVRRDAALKEANLALAEDEPITAAERYRAALNADPNSTAATLGLESANRQAAALYLKQALRQADHNALSSARQSLTDALEYDSAHPGVVAALRSLDLPAAKHPVAYRDALIQAEAQRWEDALALLDNATASDPHFLPARAAVLPLRQRAAESLIASAQSHISDNQLAPAEADYERAKSLQPDHREISRGLAEVQIAKAELLEKDGRHGAALLAYRQANTHRTSVHARDAIIRLKSQITDQHRVAARVQPAPTATDQIAAADLADRVAQALASTTFPVTVAAEGQAVSVDLTKLTIDPVKTSSDAKRFTYKVPEQVDNPEVDILKSRLAALETQLRYARYFHGPTRYRVRTNRYENYHHNSSYSYGRRYDYDRLYEEYRCTARDLINTPRTLTVYREESHPYTLFTHTQTAQAQLTYALADAQPRTIRASFRETDTSIDSPKPSLGLPADGKSLTPDPQVHEILLTQSTTRLTDAIARSLTQQRVAELRAAASTAASNNDPIAATESKVAAAVLVESIDPAVAQQLLTSASTK